MFDACNMLKLTRNMLASLEKIKDSDGKVVDWRFIKNLFDFQDAEH